MTAACSAMGIQRRPRHIDTPDMPIAPMIDCVFLMLVYFMTTSSLERSEADLHCPLSGRGQPSNAMAAIDEQRIQLDSGGGAIWNGSAFDLIGDPASRISLTSRLIAFREGSVDAGSEPRLQLLPDAQAPHQAWIHLLDAISNSGITAVEFP